MTAVFQIEAARAAGLPVGVQVECGTNGLDLVSCPRCGWNAGDVPCALAGEVRVGHESHCDAIPVTETATAEATRLATNILGVGLVRILGLAR